MEKNRSVKELSIMNFTFGTMELYLMKQIQFLVSVIFLFIILITGFIPCQSYIFTQCKCKDM